MNMKEQKPDIRDSDVRAALAKIAPGNEISVEINKPYRCGYGEEKDRMWDKIYSMNGLKVFVEAELGAIYKVEGYEPQTMKEYLMTPEQCELSKKKMEEKMSKEKKIRPLIISPSIIGFFFPDICGIEGPLVDKADDTELKTIRVVSALAQYQGLDLSEFGPEWKGFIETIKSKYNLEIKAQSSNVKEPSLIRPKGGLIMHDRHEPEEKIPLVFSSTITKKQDLEKICYVYYAGSTLKETIDDITKFLVKKYLDMFKQ